MRHSAKIFVFLASCLLATAVEAGPKANKDDGKDHSESSNCPPGLAKKNPPCVPPGLARRNDGEHDDEGRDEEERDDRDPLYVHTYPIGHILPDAYVILFDPLLFPDWQHAVYVRSGDFLYLIDRPTGAVLQNFGPVADWRWGWSQVDFAHCPPGLAKKNPPCVPPGQAKKLGLTDPWRTGDHLPQGYSVLLTPLVQQGPDTSVYVRLGDSVYRIDRQTGQVLDTIGAISALLH